MIDLQEGDSVKAWSDDRYAIECFYLSKEVINGEIMHFVSINEEPCFGGIDCFEYVEKLK